MRHLLVATILFVALLSRAQASELPCDAGPSDPNTTDSSRFFFGQIHQLEGATALNDFECWLRQIAPWCKEIEMECLPATEILKRIYGETLRENLPDFIVYLERDESGTLRVSRPVLMWKGRNTPYLFGARHIYVLVLSREKVRLEAKITTVYEKPANPFAGILALVGAPDTDSDQLEPKSSSSKVSWSHLYPTGGPEDGRPGFWLGSARLNVGRNSVNRVTVYVPQPVLTAEGSTTSSPGTSKVETVSSGRTSVTTITCKSNSPDKCPDTAGKEKTAQPSVKAGNGTGSDAKKGENTGEQPANTETKITEPNEKTTTTRTAAGETVSQVTKSTISGPAPLEDPEKVGFIAANGHFSNSKAAYAAFSVALAGTNEPLDAVPVLDPNGVQIGETDPDDVRFNAYVFAKIYLPHFRPRLKVEPRSRQLHRSSLGVVMGTNVTGDTFDELVVGLAWGHIVGSTGIVAGANRLAATDDMPARWRFLLGLDYTF